MVKTLSAIGNSFGLIIDRPLLELLGISRDTPLEIRTDGESLIVRPIRRELASRGTDLRGSVRYEREEDLLEPVDVSWEADS